MLKNILSISGQSGLYKMVSEANNKLIVESIETGKRMPAYSSLKISALEDIAIYTEEGEESLEKIFTTIYKKENGNRAISHKSSANELKSYFEEILPNYDRDRVYVSDIKKIIMWYNLLSENDMIDFKEEDELKDEKEEKVVSDEDN